MPFKGKRGRGERCSRSKLSTVTAQDAELGPKLTGIIGPPDLELAADRRKGKPVLFQIEGGLTGGKHLGWWVVAGCQGLGLASLVRECNEPSGPGC